MKRKIFALPRTGPSQTVLLPLHTLNSIQSQAVEWVFKINVLLCSALAVLQFGKTALPFFFEWSSFHLYVPTTAASVPLSQRPFRLPASAQTLQSQHLNPQRSSPKPQIKHELMTQREGATSQQSYDKCLNPRRGQRDRFGLKFGFSRWWYQQDWCCVFSHIAPGRVTLVGRWNTWNCQIDFPWNIHGPQRLHPSNFADPLTFRLVPPCTQDIFYHTLLSAKQRRHWQGFPPISRAFTIWRNLHASLHL